MSIKHPKTKRDRVYLKIVELILLIATVLITAGPALLCLMLLFDSYKTDRMNRLWQTIAITIATIPAILGFLALIFRAIQIFTGSRSRMVTILLLLGIGTYLFFIIPTIPDLWRHKKLLILYSVPVIAISLSLRNIYFAEHLVKENINVESSCAE